MEQINPREDPSLSRIITDQGVGVKVGVAGEWELDHIQDLKSKDKALNDLIK